MRDFQIFHKGELLCSHGFRESPQNGDIVELGGRGAFKLQRRWTEDGDLVLDTLPVPGVQKARRISVEQTGEVVQNVTGVKIGRLG